MIDEPTALMRLLGKVLVSDSYPQNVGFMFENIVVIDQSIDSQSDELFLFLLLSLIGRYVYHCGWSSLKPRDSNFGQIWKPGTREITMLFLSDRNWS
jgi:hypothetical protein